MWFYGICLNKVIIIIISTITIGSIVLVLAQLDKFFVRVSSLQLNSSYSTRYFFSLVFGLFFMYLNCTCVIVYLCIRADFVISFAQLNLYVSSWIEWDSGE
jgi:hypothetical protein